MPKPLDEIVEVVARAIYDAPGPDGDHIAVYFAENFRCEATNAAESRDWALKVLRMAVAKALAALEKAGYMVVSKEAHAIVKANIDDMVNRMKGLPHPQQPYTPEPREED